MKINQKVKMPLTWFWCVDVFFYSMAFPVINCIVNKQLTVVLYAVPSLIICSLGGLLNLKITEKNTMRNLYDNWFLEITLTDATVWIVYFILWLFREVPDDWYPVAAAVMHVSTVQLSKAIRCELKNRLFPESSEKTEFENACGILYNFFNAFGSVAVLTIGLNSFIAAKLIMLVAMTVDNVIFVKIWHDFEKKKIF